MKMKMGSKSLTPPDFSERWKEAIKSELPPDAEERSPNPWKPLLVLKSKKGFGVWNTEVNLRFEQVSFTSDEVVLTGDLLNAEGVSLCQRREYRISWENRHAPPSGLLKRSGGTETWPYDAKNAYPEYYAPVEVSE